MTSENDIYSNSREHAPSIIFMDEIDSIGSSRLEGGSGGKFSSFLRAADKREC